MVLPDQGTGPHATEVRALARNPRRARARLADTLEACWHRLVEPFWPRILDLLSADIVHHSMLLAQGGLARVLPAISSRVTWTGSTVRVDTSDPRRYHRRSRGEGLLLQPSVFAWPNVVAIWAERYPPVIVYPARGVAELWQPATTPVAEPLASLLGRTRTTLLASVREPASTTVLARRHRLAAATVSEHLHALAAARLVTRARAGRSVVYRTTRLGEALLSGDTGQLDD